MSSIQMFIRLFTIVALSSVLLSCSMKTGGDGSYGDGFPDERTAKMPMAGNRGLNVDMMDYRLHALIGEAQKLDFQMDMLIARMNALHSEIKKHKQTADGVEVLAVVETPHVLEAIDEGRSAVNPKVKIIEATNAGDATVSLVVVSPSTKPEHVEIIAGESPITSDGVQDVRYGLHKDKTRLVFDIHGSTKHSVDFDKEVGLVAINLEQSPWNTTEQKTYKLQQLSGYEAKQIEQGSIVALAVKNTSSVKTSVIGKSGSKPARLIIDLMK